IARAVNDFLQRDLLARADPAEQQRPDRDTKLRTVLDQAAARIGGRFAGQPLVEAALRLTVGDAYRSLGEYDIAQPHLERAWELRRRLLGDGHAETLAAQRALAALRLRQGRPADAEALLAQALRHCRQELGEEHPETLRVMQLLAEVSYHYLARYDQAEELLRRLLAVHGRVSGADHADTLTAHYGLGVLYWVTGRPREAETHLQRAAEGRRRVLGEAHPQTLTAMNELGALYVFDLNK